MNIDQLYDAFENILHIKMPEDEFKILFRKVIMKIYYFIFVFFINTHNFSFLLIIDKFKRRWKYYME